MKRIPVLFVVVVCLSGLLGCYANLFVKSASIDFEAKTVMVEIANHGCADAGEHVTYIEINDIGVPDSSKPQSQYSSGLMELAKGETWSPDPIPFDGFSSPRGLDLNALTAANLVVRADAKDMVNECSEDDNLFDEDL